MKLRRNKNEERAGKLLLKELPYFDFRGCLAQCHGQFNSSISDTVQTRRNLDKLTSLYDLGIFNLNTVLDVKDVRANCFCASLLRTQIHTPRHTRARALSNKMRDDRAKGHCYSFAWI